LKDTGKDQRTQLTYSLLRQAFTDLLKHKPIQRITVKELCQKAGVNRSTFYAHYVDIYDLLAKLEEDMVEDFQKALDPLLGAGTEEAPPLDDAQLEEPSLLRIMTGIYQCLKDNVDICTVTLGEHGDKAFAVRILSLGWESCLAAYSNHLWGASPRQLEYFYAFVSNGHIGLLQKWLEEGMTTSVEEMARMAQDIMLHGMDFLRGSAQAREPDHTGQ
jgi:AcrR family transcriptional regulator